VEQERFMNMVIVVFVVWFAVVLGGGAWWATRMSKGTPLAERAESSQVKAFVDEGVSRFGRLPMAALVYFAGAGVILAVCWPLGLLAHGLQDAVDWPVFRWTEHRQIQAWSDLWLKLTNIGKPRLTQGVDALAAVFFAVVWAVRRRAWWAPLVLFASAYALEKYCQIILQTVVDRGHPPTTLGTYPSGGCARVLIVYGLVTFMVVEWRWPQSRRAWRVAMVVVAFLWSIQAYARLYNLEHWLTDVVGGTVFGLLGLLLMVGCARVLVRHRGRAPVEGPEPAAPSPEGSTTWRLSARA
jgi:membrane-associated phospholipid phosphatase